MYKVEYWKKKKIQLSVKGGELTVIAPYGTKPDDIQRTVKKHKRWIKNHLEYAKKKNEIEGDPSDEEIKCLKRKW